MYFKYPEKIVCRLAEAPVAHWSKETCRIYRTERCKAKFKLGQRYTPFKLSDYFPTWRWALLLATVCL